VKAPGTSLTLTVRTDVNQGGNDESGGFDNFLIQAFPIPPNLQISKSAAILDTIGNGGYATPGNSVEYSFSLGNTGGPVDPDTLVLIDKLPQDVTLFTGDLDGLGQPVVFTDTSSPASGLSCCAATNISFADETTGSPVFDYIAATPYDSNVTYIRIAPIGTLRDGQIDPVATEFQFQVRID